MPTTANYGWTIPADTDLVKDGAAAIRTLGNAIDTTAAASFGGGLVKINTTSFSGVASQSFNNVFSSTYDYYRIICNLQPSGTFDLTMRLRVSGTDNTNALYNYEGFIARATNVNTSVSSATNQTSFIIAGTNAGQANAFSMDVYKPFNNDDYTKYALIGHMHDSTSYSVSLRGGVFGANTSFDGFTIITGGTMTGSIQIYGYKK